MISFLFHQSLSSGGGHCEPSRRVGGGAQREKGGILSVIIYCEPLPPPICSVTKGHQFDSRSGHMPGFQPQLGGMREATDQSFSPSIPLFLKINKYNLLKNKVSLLGNIYLNHVLFFFINFANIYHSID